MWELLCGKASSLPPPIARLDGGLGADRRSVLRRGPQDRQGLGWRSYRQSTARGSGYGLAAVIGVALGTLIGQSVWAMRGLDPFFQVLRTISPLAWLPLSLAAFRDSQPSAIFVIFITSVWPIIINTAVGIRNIPEDYRNVARVLRLNQFEFFMQAS